jgi:hypothetical protein
VTGKPGIARFDNGDQRFERRNREAFDLGALASELGPQVDHFLLEQQRDAPLARRLHTAAQASLHRGLELGQIYRLSEVVHGAVLEIVNRLVHIATRARYHYRQMGITIERPGEKLSPGRSEQPSLGDHAGNFLASQDTERLLAVAGGQHFVATVGQMGFDGLSGRRLVVDYQDPVRHFDHRCELLARPCAVRVGGRRRRVPREL